MQNNSVDVTLSVAQGLLDHKNPKVVNPKVMNHPKTNHPKTSPSQQKKSWLSKKQLVKKQLVGMQKLLQQLSEKQKDKNIRMKLPECKLKSILSDSSHQKCRVWS